MKRVIVLPDMQIPYEDKRSLAAVEAYMADHRWDEWIQLGDFMDFDYLSRWTKDSPRLLEGKRLLADYARANALLDRHQEIVRKNNPDAKFTILQGNHDWRVENAIDKAPAFEGLIELEIQLKLKERGIKYHKYWENKRPYSIGKADFIHGEYTNDAHAKKTVLQFGNSTFYGHVHDVQCYSQVRRGKDKTIVGQSLGCLCKYDLSYVGQGPTKWQQAFGVFHFFEDGHFSYYVPMIFKHRFCSPEGKVYQG